MVTTLRRFYVGAVKWGIFMRAGNGILRTMLLLFCAVGAVILPSAGAQGQTAPAPEVPPASEDVTVISTSPLVGGGIEASKIPGTVTVIGRQDITQTGPADVLYALNTEVPGLSMDSAAGNPYQPTIFYNGFESSPLQGTSQGIAVYLNGVRFNQAFGDTVNWDLIPDLALDRITVEGANPVFGLNALGGSLDARLKNGFTYQGGEADISGGSFGQIQAEFQYGAKDNNRAFYVAGSELHQGGWRDLQSSDIQNLYADLGWRADSGEFHLNMNLANSVLNGPGTAPVELLAADSAAQFTAPNLIANKYAQFAASGTTAVSDELSLQANAYYSYFLQHVVNGNAPNDAPCDDASGLLCQAPGVPSTTVGGRPIPDFLHGGPYSELDLQTTNTNSYGASIQATDTGDIWGIGNHLVAGTSFDGASTGFSAGGLIGGLSPGTRIFIGPGILIDEPGNNVPVRAAITDSYEAVFVTDTLDITSALSLTVSGRFNSAEIDLSDRNGGDLTGNHAYNRFNPSVGTTYRIASWLSLYASYAETNRAPTPAELSCAGPNDSCSLANFFVGDPDLKQVVGHTIEVGARGHFTAENSTISYQIGAFRTDADDDIVFINSVTLGRAYFTNIGQTRRQGLSTHVSLLNDDWSIYANYTYTEATFQSGFVESGGSNPAQDANGNLTIVPGDRLPGIPTQRFTFGGDLQITKALDTGINGALQSGQYLFGDEANLTPKLPGNFVLNARVSYQITPRIQVFARVDNITNLRYYQYGTFSPTNSIYLSQAPYATNPRSYNIAAPIGGWGGIKVTF